MTSPFAAATQSYGDQRCGFATDAIDRQQQQQLAVPTVQQAELLLQKLPAGDQDAGAADAQQLQEWRQRWNAVSSSVAGLEQLASAATMQYMDAQGGCCICVCAIAPGSGCCAARKGGKFASCSAQQAQFVGNR